MSGVCDPAVLPAQSQQLWGDGWPCQVRVLCMPSLLACIMLVHVYKCATMCNRRVCCSWVWMDVFVTAVHDRLVSLDAVLLTEAWHGVCAVSCPRLRCVLTAAVCWWHHHAALEGTRPPPSCTGLVVPGVVSTNQSVLEYGFPHQSQHGVD